MSLDVLQVHKIFQYIKLYLFIKIRGNSEMTADVAEVIYKTKSSIILKFLKSCYYDFSTKTESFFAIIAIISFIAHLHLPYS